MKQYPNNMRPEEMLSELEKLEKETEELATSIDNFKYIHALFLVLFSFIVILLLINKVTINMQFHYNDNDKEIETKVINNEQNTVP